ncbi:MAG: hypothetical protein ACLUMK_10710 [Christensenellales bacterium]
MRNSTIKVGDYLIILVPLVIFIGFLLAGYGADRRFLRYHRRAGDVCGALHRFHQGRREAVAKIPERFATTPSSTAPTALLICAAFWPARKSRFP